MEIIKRFAAGTISVCFAYAMIRQPFNTIRRTGGTEANWKKIVISESVTEPSTEEESVTEPSTEEESVTEPSSEEEIVMDPSAEEEVVDESSGEVIAEDRDFYEDDYEEETIGQQAQTNDDKPTLAQFLSGMVCGGCHRRCLLISPSCMRGQSKAEMAMEEYYEIYGE